MPESQSEFIEKPKNRVEQLLEKSHFAGNFSEPGQVEMPSKDIYMIELDGIKEYVQFLPHLPNGFGISGGVARGALLNLLGDKPPTPRDLDVSAVREFIVDREDVKKISEEFPPGEGRPYIEVNDNLVSYFSSRDFTINEVFIYGNKLYYSRQALEDVDTKTIRLSDHHLDEDIYTWEDIHPLRRLKALLLQIDFIKYYGNSSISEINGWKWKIGDIPGFDLALSLKKAIEKKNQISFLKELVRYRFIDEVDIPDGYSVETIRRLAGLAIHRMIAVKDDRMVDFGSDYFNQAYTEEMQHDDNLELAKYNLLQKNAVKLRHVTPDDLNW